MRHSHFYAAASAVTLALLLPSLASAQAKPADKEDIVVTARKRQERLKDVPVAATAISGATIERRGLTSVKDVAALTPSLNINSDGAGRAFIAIRGVGTTLIDTVQPGVGIFIDGIYQPNTSYLNNPLVDVARVEILRGPQGTLYGKNTLGGAINVITRLPDNELQVKMLGSYAGSDNSWTAATSISGPIIKDKLKMRLGFAHHEEKGFSRNTLINVDAMPVNSDTLSATIHAEPATDVNLTINGYYTWLKGGGVSYAFVTSPSDFNTNVQLNASNYQFFKYRGLNAKLDFPIEALASTVTLIGAYDKRTVDTPDADPDFTSANTLRSNGQDSMTTKTAELRLDSKISPTITSIIGAFYSREERNGNNNAIVLPGIFNFLNNTKSSTMGDSYALFGNIFWRPNTAWEVSLGLRWDQQNRTAAGLITDQFPVPGVTVTGGKLSEKNLSPRFAVSYRPNEEWMIYGSVARGSRGGGFNGPNVAANLRTYKGDHVWTYELGTKYASADGRTSLSAAFFYNNYKDYIGLNSIAPAGVSFATVDLNTGDVKSYGFEIEAMLKPTDQWTLSGGASLMNARLQNTKNYTALTGRTLDTNRLPFQPDWNFNLNSDYVIPVGEGSVTWNAALIGKGSRTPASLRQITPEIPGQPNTPNLKAYMLINSSLTYRKDGFEIAAFVDNMFDKDYFEAYIERTTLILAGLPATDIGIIGTGRRFGVRTRVQF